MAFFDASSRVENGTGDFLDQKLKDDDEKEWVARDYIKNTTEENCKYLPIYTGLSNDEEQGLCIGTENYVAVNTLATEEDQLASIAFLEWVYSSDVGKSYVTNELQFITVFNTFSASEAPSNPLAVEVSSYLNDTSKSSVPWNFTSFPGQEFKDGLSDHLYAYATGQEGWEKVDEYVVQKWAEMKSGE